MGHRLPFHKGGCANIHGHSYRLLVEISGICDEHGMLVDYADVKRIVRPVLAPLDHAFMCEREDTLLKEFLESNGFRVFIVDFPTTAENIARLLCTTLWDKFKVNPRVTGLKIRIHETSNSTAEVSLVRDS